MTDYPESGEAQIAQTMLGRQRLIVRRTRLVGAQAELWPDWRHHAFLTNRTDAIELVEAEHRQHAVVELAIRDLKDQALAHFPSGKFLANAAWTVIAALAHNLLRWTTLIGLPDTTIPTARTLRRRLLTVPGRITRTARTGDTPDARPLAMGDTVPHRASTPPRRARAHLTDPRGHDDDRHRTPGLGLPEHHRPAPPRRPQLAPPRHRASRSPRSPDQHPSTDTRRPISPPPTPRSGPNGGSRLRHPRPPPRHPLASAGRDKHASAQLRLGSAHTGSTTGHSRPSRRSPRSAVSSRGAMHFTDGESRQPSQAIHRRDTLEEAFPADKRGVLPKRGDRQTKRGQRGGTSRQRPRSPAKVLGGGQSAPRSSGRRRGYEETRAARRGRGSARVASGRSPSRACPADSRLPDQSGPRLK